MAEGIRTPELRDRSLVGGSLFDDPAASVLLAHRALLQVVIQRTNGAPAGQQLGSSRRL